VRRRRLHRLGRRRHPHAPPSPPPTRRPSVPSSVARLASSARAIASAIGLRHVLPVHTNRIVRRSAAITRSSVIRPPGATSNAPLRRIRTVVEGPPARSGPSSRITPPNPGAAPTRRSGSSASRQTVPPRRSATSGPDAASASERATTWSGTRTAIHPRPSVSVLVNTPGSTPSTPCACSSAGASCSITNRAGPGASPRTSRRCTGVGSETADSTASTEGACQVNRGSPASGAGVSEEAAPPSAPSAVSDWAPAKTP
jgi:hypothetical protein